MAQLSIQERVENVLNEATGRDLTSWEKNTLLKKIKYLEIISPDQNIALRRIELRLGLVKGGMPISDDIEEDIYLPPLKL